MEEPVAQEREINVQEVETELSVRDKDTNAVIAKITVGQIIPYAGIWLRVVRVAENEVVLRPESYTGKRIKKMFKKEKRNDRG